MSFFLKLPLKQKSKQSAERNVKAGLSQISSRKFLVSDFSGKVLDKKKFRKVNGGVCYLSKLKQVIFDNSLNDVTLRRYTFHKIVV